MPDIQTTSVALSGEQRAALEATSETDEDVRRLREMWDEGKASGAAEPLDIERTLAAAKARLGDFG